MLCLSLVLAIGATLAEETGQSEIAKWDPNMAQRAFLETNEIKWIDGECLPIEGRAYSDTEHYYDRLPACVTTNVNEGVRSMKHHTSGMQFRFVTDSTELTFKWVPYFENLSMDHMPATGVSGIDVYRFDVGANVWRYVATGRIWDAKKGGSLTIPWTSGTPCLVNLPLYNGLRTFLLGVNPQATVSALPPRASGITKPVAFYGTSITHGGCCSRPGLAFPSIVGRHLDVPIVNLGFSGSGCGEFEMSEHLAAIDASCYVVDCIWNMNQEIFEKNYERFVRNLRRLRPDTPIVLVEACDVYCGAKKEADILRLNVRVKALHNRLLAEGWKCLYLLESSNLFTDDFEGTVDGCHPNDWGMMNIARGFENAIRMALARRGAPKCPAPLVDRL